MTAQHEPFAKGGCTCQRCTTEDRMPDRYFAQPTPSLKEGKGTTIRRLPQ